jgi:hypothetical protein
MKILKNSKLKVAHASLVPAQLGSAHGFDGLASGPNLPRFSLVRRSFFWKYPLVPIFAASASIHLAATTHRCRSPSLHSTTDPTPTPMALKAGGEGPKPPVNDPGGGGGLVS